ncbi:MAG: hypothetical protein JWO79_4855 [Actinomycetia bacterium]|nr:hypothetical protein [Actinomycetes bacterium]MDQ1659284.1 hypothetical protein [Cryptosporangiaceae bacterium]
MRLFRLLISTVLAILAVLTFGPSPGQAAVGPRITLRALVVTDGSATVEAIRGQLASEGVPVTAIDLRVASRQKITAAFLETTSGSVAVAKFQSVVLPNENPFGNATELTVLSAYEAKFGIRQVDAFTYASPAVGLTYPGYLGPLDGKTAAVTAAGKSGPFRYLDGPVPFEDNSTSVDESYAFLAAPMPDDPKVTGHFEPMVTVNYPNMSGSGVLAGVYTHSGRTEMVLTFAFNPAQRQFRLLAHGLVTWMTKGIHFGYQRNYFALHVDDIFLPDSRWSVTGHCTPGENCTDPAVTTPDIRMVPDDVTKAVQWQKDNGFTFDLYFNAGGSAQQVTATGSDPLATSFLANKAQFRWGNHTYEHPFLGCVQDVSVVPWKCTTNAAGAVQYVTKADIVSQITQNKTWATQNGVPIQAGELVTGEHSGFFILPQQPADNPNLGPAFTQTGILWAGSDHSRDPNQRKVGSALTVPRHPMNIFFNVAKKSEEAAEYNWIYASRANGGSGLCEDNPATTTCLAPMDPATGFDSKIVPTETAVALSHILSNDPRPHYVHQSNLTEDRIIYPVLDSILGAYKGLFADSTPIVNQRMSEIGAQLQRESLWKTVLANGTVSGYVQDGKVTITGPSSAQIPLTMPEGTKTVGLLGSTATFGTAYAGERSAYAQTAGLSPTLTLTVPAA